MNISKLVDELTLLGLVERRILLVDEDPVELKQGQANLQAAGFDVVTATHAAEAIERERTEAPDAIASHIVMPEVAGFAFCNMIWCETAVGEDDPHSMALATRGGTYQRFADHRVFALWKRVGRPSRPKATASGCGWTRSYGPFHEGHPKSVPMWVCDHPFRVLLLDRPSASDCAICPRRPTAPQTSKACDATKPHDGVEDAAAPRSMSGVVATLDKIVKLARSSAERIASNAGVTRVS